MEHASLSAPEAKVICTTPSKLEHAIILIALDLAGILRRPHAPGHTQGHGCGSAGGHAGVPRAAAAPSDAWAPWGNQDGRQIVTVPIIIVVAVVAGIKTIARIINMRFLVLFPCQG
eukprot:scaffold269049_cov18-Tisochrysis_lutea.AAC.1